MAFPLKAPRSAHDDWRLLWSAIDTDDVDKLVEILRDGSLANCIDANGVTPLLHAVCQNRAQIVRTLVEHGANVNAVRADGFTPLLLASFFGYKEIVQALVQQGANLSATTRFGTSAKIWATARGFYDIAEYLQQWQDNHGKLGLVTAPPIDDDSVHKSRNDLRSEKEDVEIEPDGTWFSEEISSRSVPANHSTATTAGKRDVAESSTALPVIRKLKEPPDIWDLVHENPSNFHPGSALVSRILSAKLTAILSMLAVMAILGTCTFVGLRLRTQSKQSTVKEFTPASEAPLVQPSGESSSANKPQLDKESTAPDQTQSLSSTGASPVLAVESNELPEKKLSPPYKSNDTHALNASSQPIVRRRSKIAQPTAEQVNNLSQTDSDPVVKSPAAQKLQTVESNSNDNTRASDDSPTTKKPSNPATNSQLITRPFGSSTTKPKVIQWP